jgi:hypothetical protein
MAVRFTKADMEIINDALAYYEAEVEDRVGCDEWDYATETSKQAQAELVRLRAVRDKVHHRLDS